MNPRKGGKEGRDYTGWALVAAGTAVGWVMRKLYLKEIAVPAATGKIDNLFVPVSEKPASTSEPLGNPAAIFSAERALFSEKGAEPMGTFLVVCAFLVAVAGALGFLLAYWMGAPHLLIGISAAVSLGGFGAGLVLWAHWLMDDQEVVEAREALSSGTREREAVSAQFFDENQVRRRKLLVTMSAGVLGAFAAAAVSLARSLGKAPKPSLSSTNWTRGQRLVTMEGNPVTLATLQAGDTLSVFPENFIGSENAQTVLVRVNQDLLRLPRERASWAPGGYLAYSRVCTHAGCTVGVYEAETCLLQCPCHQSTFDVLAAAKPTGGPAARALPQLPLYADEDGVLRAGGAFSDWPGPGFWGMA